MIDYLDIWTIQYYPDCLYLALENLKKDNDIIIYSNTLCELKIGNINIKTRSFDTILYSLENDILILVMEDGKVGIKDILKYLDDKKMKYKYFNIKNENLKSMYKDGDNIPELWFAREKYVLDDAINESKKRNVTSCDFYPEITSNLNLYYKNDNIHNEILNLNFKGVLIFKDKILLFVNNGNVKNISRDEIIDILNENKFKVNIKNTEPKIYVNDFSKVIENI